MCVAGAGLRVAVGFLGAAGVGFVVGPCVVAGSAELGGTVPDPEVLAAGVAVDCAAPDCPTPDQPSISNPNRTTKRPHPRQRRRKEKANIIPLYSELDATGAAGESLI